MFFDTRLILTSCHLLRQQRVRQQRLMRLTVCLLTALLSVSLIGCDNADTDHSKLKNTPQVSILDDEVIIDKSLVYSSNPERYQPSYNLRGTLAPISQVEVRSPYTGDQLQLEVRQGSWVKQGDTLATLVTKLNRDVALFAHHEHITMSIKDDDLWVTPTHDTESVADSRSGHALEDIASDIADEVMQEEKALQASLDNEVQLYDSKTPSATYKKASPEPSIHSAQDSDKPLTAPSSIQTKDTTVSKADAKTKPAGDDNAPKQALTDPPSATSPNQAAIEGNPNTTISNSDAAVMAKIKEKKLDPARTLKQDKLTTLLTFQAPIEGEVISIHQAAANRGGVVTDTPFITIADTRQLQLIGKLPLTTGDKSTESQLSVGQPVNFKIYDVNTEFSGQISHVTPYPDKGYVVVRAPVIPNAENKAILEYGMQALMTIEYGQVELGVRLPRNAIHEAGLDELNQKYTRPVSPIQGYVWVIEQNSRLTYTPVEVVQYFPESDKFLVHGISNDSLICLADLPKDSDGKKLSID